MAFRARTVTRIVSFAAVIIDVASSRNGCEGDYYGDPGGGGGELPYETDGDARRLA